MAPSIGFGRIIHGDLIIPGTIGMEAASVPVGQPNLHVRLLPTLQRDALPRREATVEGGRVTLSVPRLCRMRCAVGQIEVEPCEEADPTQLQAVIVATAIPTVLWIEQALVLHAGAVLLPGRDRATLVAGHSGVGKSTMIKALTARGARLIADDSVRLVAGDTCWRASGLPGGWFFDRPDGSRRFHRLASGSCPSEAAVGEVLFMSRTPAAWAIGEVRGAAAVEAVLVHRHRPQVPALLGRADAVFRQSAGFAAVTRCWSWCRHAGTADLTDGEYDRLLALSACG